MSKVLAVIRLKTIDHFFIKVTGPPACDDAVTQHTETMTIMLKFMVAKIWRRRHITIKANFTVSYGCLTSVSAIH